MKTKISIIGLLLLFCNPIWSQIKELSEAENYKISSKNSFKTLDEFGLFFVDAMNSKSFEAVEKLLVNKKTLSKTVKKKSNDAEVSQQLEKELLGDFDKRVIAGNLKKLKKFYSKLPEGTISFQAIKIEEKINDLGFSMAKAVLEVSQNNKTYTVNIARVVKTVKGWKALELLDYFTDFEPVEISINE